MVNPIPNELPQYSFLPWLRRGVINLAGAGSISLQGPVSVSLSLNVEGAGEAPEVVNQQVQLYGPGDIYGVGHDAIVRTIPRAGVRNFEANYLCGIEFYEEDFPWRYTPALPAAGKLPPWIWLVVLRDDEFVRRVATEISLPAIEISSDVMQKAFPDPSTTWAWAHTHLNGKAEGTTPDAISKWVDTLLNSDPNLGCSRLLCPRRLQPSTHYTAFLIPAFEKGRLAGLGKEEAAIAAAPNAALSWLASPDGSRQFPVYFEWEFTTQSDGDFESLAKKLTPLTDAEEAALNSAGKLIDISEPGWGLKYPGEKKAVLLGGALKPAGRKSTPVTGSADGPEQPSANDITFLKELADLLNLGVTSLTAGAEKAKAPNAFFAGSQLEDDPMIIPPLYGSFYRNNPLTVNPAIPVHVNAATPVKDWYNQLNLDPALRLAAAQGTAIVQKNQEEYMDRAWDSLGQTYEVSQLLKRNDYSSETSQKLYNKRIQPMLQAAQGSDERTFYALSFMAPLHQKITYSDKSVSFHIREKNIPTAYSRSFTKIIRKGGPLMRRLNKQAGTGTFFSKMVTAPVVKNALLNSLKQAATLVIVRDHRNGSQNEGDIYNSSLAIANERLKRVGLVEYNLWNAALTALMPYVEESLLIFQVTTPGNWQLCEHMMKQIDPTDTVAARLKALLPGPGTAAVSAFPGFREPMYKELAGRSGDYILPGLDQVPPNRVALLQQDQSFIESFMVGLNHEMAREYLWREFPAPLNSTPFRQFWDVRDNHNPTVNKQDINLISLWNTTALGTHRPVPSAVNNIVMLIRGELLRKYPNTEVFMQKKQAENVTVLYPAFSGSIDPDYKFFGFSLTAEQAVGGSNDPGWFFVLKERSGDIHFGLDINAGGVSWVTLEQEVPENSCINATSSAFKSLQPNMPERADHIAALLYQQPFMLLLHASRIISKK